MYNLCGPLAVLVILVTDVSTLVPRTENVTVSCNNFETIVYWNYSGQSQQPSFDLEIIGDESWPNKRIRSIKQQHYNLSHLTLDLLDRYFVNITAYDGAGGRSGTGQSSFFSFNKEKTAVTYCTLDFPAVNLAMTDHMVEVSFKNPNHLYAELNKPHIIGDKKVFHWKVFDEGTQESIHTFDCKYEICGENFPVPEKKEEYCFSLEGNVMNHRIVFKRTGPICPPNKNENNPWKIYLPIILSLTVLAAIVILITSRKFWGEQNQRFANFPKSLASLISNTNDKNCHMHLPHESMSPISSIEPAVTQTLLEMPEENKFDPQYPVDYRESSDALSDTSSLLNTEMEERSSCPVLCGDSMVSESGYDSRHVVEMSPGDVVVGYGPT